MRHFTRFSSKTLCVLSVTLTTVGCKKEAERPAAHTVNLRVVMFVETGADLNDPPVYTGGCKLRKTQVTKLMDELVAAAPSFSPGLTLAWDGTVNKLESDCFDYFPIMFFPLCFSACSQSIPFAGDCPIRNMALTWFFDNVVGHGSGGPAALQQADAHVPGECTVNIYFVGNVLDLNGDLIGGITIPPQELPGLRFFVLVNDGAGTDPTGQAQANFSAIDFRHTLLHEVACHWLKRDGSHTEDGQGSPQCPNNLCIGGQRFDACQAVLGDKRPLTFLKDDQDTVGQNAAECD